MIRTSILIPALSLFILTFLLSCTSETELMIDEPEVVTDGFQFTEGPFWHPDGFLLFSDIPANTIYKWEPENSESEVYIEPSGNSNGITSSPDGTVLLAQHSGKVSQVNDDLTLTVLAEEFNGNRLNSPNDIVARSDGKIFFTDPPFGVSDEDRELDFSGVFRLDQDGTLTLLYDGFEYPNGIALSPDESKLYVNDSATGQILRFDLLEDGSVTNETLFASVGERDDTGAADGMKTDSEGRLYSTGPGGLSIFDAEGNRIQIIEFDERITNLAWGDSDYSRIYVTAPNSVYRVQTNVTGQ
jgi:gluconolactonase